MAKKKTTKKEEEVNKKAPEANVKSDTKEPEVKTPEPEVKTSTEEHKEAKAGEFTEPEVKATEPVVEEKSKKVEVDADVIKSMQDEIKRLTAAADLNRLAKYDQEQANKNELIKKVKVSFIDGKAVLARKTVKDEVFVDSRGVYHETQILELTLEGGDKEEMNYLDYIKKRDKRVSEVVSETRSSEGNVMKVRFPDGKTLEIDDKFIN